MIVCGNTVVAYFAVLTSKWLFNVAYCTVFIFHKQDQFFLLILIVEVLDIDLNVIGDTSLIFELHRTVLDLDHLLNYIFIVNLVYILFIVVIDFKVQTSISVYVLDSFRAAEFILACVNVGWNLTTSSI